MAKLRKVQQTRTGTFFVCLPRSWAEQRGLKKGAQVALNESSDGRLCIDVEPAGESVPKVAVLSPGSFLERELVGRYLLGFDVIRVEAKERFDFDVRNMVKRTVSSLVGLEIVEETSSLMVLQSFLEPSSLVPEKLLLRNFAIVDGMNRDAVTSLVEGDLQLAHGVVARDDESDRQYFLLVRVLRSIIQNSSLSEKLELAPIDCLDYRLAASLVESMGDKAVQVANVALELNGVTLSEEMKSLIARLHSLCCDASSIALKAFVGKDLSLAENVRALQANINDVSGQAVNAARNQPIALIPQFSVAVTALKQVYALSVDLADLVV